MRRCLAIRPHLKELRCRNKAGNSFFCYQHKHWLLKVIIGIVATISLAVLSNFLWSKISQPSSTETKTLGLAEKTSDDVATTRQQIDTVEQLLEEEFSRQLGMKDEQITFLQGQIERLQNVEEPSPRARELAAQIPSDAAPYALALKAIAEKRFDDARKMLTEAQEIREVELSRIYEARGQTEIFAGLYTEAISWYQKGLALRPDDANLLNQTGAAFYLAGRYAEAEPLYQRSLEIREKALGKEHPDVATSLNDLAEFQRAQGRYAEAEPLYQRSLEIREKAFGKEHPDVAQSLSNLAALYRAQGKYAEADVLYRHSLDIKEKTLRKNESVR